VVSTRRRLAIIFLGAVGVFLVLALVASWLIVRVWGPSLTASRIAAAITEATGRPAHVDGVALEPLRGRVRISGLTVAGESDLQLGVERIDVAIRIESLWRRELVVGIAVRGADVHVQPGPPSDPIVFEIPERFPLGPISVRLASISVEQSRLHFEDPAHRVAIALAGLAATGRPERGGLELTARADVMDLRVEDFKQRLDHPRAEGRIDAARILVRALASPVPHAVTVTGAIEAPWSREPMLAGEAKARLALGPIARGLGATIPVQGTVAADVTLSGLLAAPVVAGRLHAELIDVAGVPVRGVSGALRLDDKAFTVADVEGRVVEGRLRGSLTIFAGRPPDALVRLRIDDADAAALARLRGGAQDVRGRLALDGEVRGDLARPMSLTGQLRVDGSELSLPGSLARLGAGRVRATARMASGQVVSDVEGRWPSASLTANARVEPDHRLRVDARARADLSALAGWTTGDSIDIAARGEGRWPQATFTAGIDLARPATRRGGRVDVRFDPVAGTAPRWSGMLRSRRLALPWADLEDLQGTMALSGDALDVSKLTARVATVPVEGSGRWMWRGTGNANLLAGPAALARLPGIPSDLALDGSARAQIEANVGTAGVQGIARVEAERVAVAKIALGRGTGEATLQGNRLAASLRFPERQLELSARGDVAPGEAVAARLVLRSFDLASLTPPPRAGQAPMLRGAISASADLAIPVDAPGNLRGKLAVDPMTIAVAGAPLSSANPIVVRIDSQRATLEPVRLGGPAGTITASGIAWDASARPLVEAKLDGGRLAALAPTLGVDGRVKVEAELSGDVGAVAGARARGKVVGDGLVLPGALASLGTGASHIDLQLGDGVLSIARGDVTFPGLSGGITGRIHLDGRIALDARVTAQGGPLGAALGLNDGSGVLTATATLGGQLGKLEGQTRVASERFAIAGIAVERIDASARLQGETVRLERLTARVLGAPLRARAEWATSGTGRAELDAGPLALGTIPVSEHLALGGALSLRVEATADRGALKARAQAQVTDAQAAGLALGAGLLTARVDGRRLEANLDLGEHRITGSARGALEPGGTIEAALDVSTLELAPLLRHLSANPDIDVEGTVAGRLTARVPWDRPSALTARARIEPIALRSRAAGLDGRGRVDGSWENGTLKLERAELAGSAGTARASGTLDAAGRLDVRFEARMLLPALLAPVTNVSGAEGTVAVQAQVIGTLTEPSVRGEGSLTGGRLALRGFPAPLRDINARVVATGGGVRLIDATAGLGAGSLRATGEAALAGRTLGLYRVRVTARDVPLRPIEGLDTVWNADLELSGTEGRSLLAGEARLARGTYTRDLVSLSALTTPERPAAPTPEVGLPLGIRAVLDDNLVVRTPQARMRVGGTLIVRGTTAAPIVIGALEARDGTLVLRGQRYQLERAVVRFADPRRIDPALDITATTRIREYDVTMRITGRIRDLDMRLTSSPSLPREQLLSLVAFGTAGGETAQGAGGALAGEAASLVIRELLDLPGTESALPGPLRAIMERTRVSYTHNSEDIGRFGLRVEYEVTGPFLLAGERTSQGYYVIDGVVRLRFR
jgi:hypothetical protein